MRQALAYARLAPFVTPEDGEVWLLIARIALDAGSSEPRRCGRSTECRPDSPVAWSANLAAGAARCRT